MKKYHAARLINLIVTVAGWVCIALAAILLVGGTGLIGRGVAITVALPLGIGGLILLATAQLTAAQLDTAENTARTVSALECLIKLQTPETQGNVLASPQATRPKIEPPMRGAGRT